MIRLNVGDIVRLKSGGPAMTVLDHDNFSENNENIFIPCVYHNGTQFVRESFPLYSLILSKSDEELRCENDKAVKEELEKFINGQRR